MTGAGAAIVLSLWSVGVAGFRLRQGFDTPSSRVAGNRVRHAGSHGIWYEEIVVPTDPVAFLGNAVDHVTGDGIRVVFAADPGPPPADSLMFNVTGQCGGHGILLSNPGTTMRVGGTTSYLNGGSGFLVQGAPVQSFDHNIGAFNNAYGLVATAAFVPACNDWFANQSGAGSGISPGPTDLALDPRFCDAVNDDVRLASSSPLANAAGCGQVGALGIGCATSAAAMTGDHRELFTASPVPASTHLQFRWRRAEAPGVLEVFDVTGARRWSTRIRTGEDGVRWETVDDTGRPLAPGMYWARLKWRSRIESTRIAIVR